MADSIGRFAPVGHPAVTSMGQPLKCERQRVGDSPKVAGLLPLQADFQRPTPSESCQSSANSGIAERMVASGRALQLTSALEGSVDRQAKALAGCRRPDPADLRA